MDKHNTPCYEPRGLNKPQQITLLFKQHKNLLLSYATSKGLSTHDAEEIVQDVFIRLNNCPTLDQIENKTAFLKTITLNLIKDRYRSSQRLPQFVEYDSLVCEQSNYEQGPEQVHDHQEALNSLQQDLYELPILTQKIFIQHRIEHKSYQSLAEHFNLSIAIVRKYIRDALVHITQRRLERD